MNMEWISVKDRLPDNDRTVFINTKNYLGLAWYEWSWNNGVWNSDAGHIKGVTHWMELPEPPKK